MNAEVLYSTWAKLRNWYLGPTIRFHEQDAERFLELDNALANTLGPPKPSSADERQLYASSPWHAAYALSLLQHHFILDRSTHLIFRGQKRSSWPLLSSIDRLSTQDETTRAIVEVWLLCNLMTKLGTDTLVMSPAPGATFDLILPPDAYVPVAQHYGFKTALLDFTADPAVAVYFASRDDEDIHEEYASVFVYQLPLKDDATHLLNLRLPPPFVERPYLQKGIYVESTVKGDLGEQIPWDIEVRFPIRAANQSFAVIREDVLTLLPESDEIAILLAYARAGVSDFIFEHAGAVCTPELIAEFCAQYSKRFGDKFRGLFKKVTPTERYIDQYVARVEDMLYWLCYCPGEETFGINLGSLNTIAISNPEVLRMVLGYYRRLVAASLQNSHMTAQERTAKSALIEVLEKALRETGRDPMSKPDLSSWLGLKT
jgi:hypothetical protein